MCPSGETAEMQALHADCGDPERASTSNVQGSWEEATAKATGGITTLRINPHRCLLGKRPKAPRSSPVRLSNGGEGQQGEGGRRAAWVPAPPSSPSGRCQALSLPFR